jgi:hypothetical protein
VDVEKPKKKKAMSATTSLVSIPNQIKLSMLNSGLLSFGKRLSEPPSKFYCDSKALIARASSTSFMKVYSVSFLFFLLFPCIMQIRSNCQLRVSQLKINSANVYRRPTIQQHSLNRLSNPLADESNPLSATIPDSPTELKFFIKLCEQRRKFPVLYKIEFTVSFPPIPSAAPISLLTGV